MGRTVPVPVEADFARARGLISEGGEMQVIALAEVFSENRWLSNIVHAGVFSAADLEKARENGFAEGFEEGREVGFSDGYDSGYDAGASDV